MNNITGHKSFPNGWECDAFLGTGPSGGGYILKDVRHKGYSFANDVRIVRISVSSTDPHQSKEKPTTFVLGTSELPVVPLTAIPPLRDVKLIEPYLPTGELSAAFASRDPLLNDDAGRLIVLQHYIFTEDSNTPKHEPTGALWAARFYPLLRFEFSKANKIHPMHFRADYRIEFNFDQYLPSTTRPTADSLIQAGIFLDEDNPSAVFGGLGRALVGVKVIESIFKHAEKPLQFEVIGQGLKKDETGVSREGDWDNIHLWPLDPISPRDSPDNLPFALPSTPGAFHCAHTHWRWAKVAFEGKIGVFKRAPQFGGPIGGPSSRKAGGPLIDAHNPNQNIRFAITKAARWGDEKDWSTQPLEFDKLAATKPAHISAGANLALLISIEVFRDLSLHPLSTGWSGTLYVHGFFFAHGAEPYPVKNFRRRALVRPGSKVPQKWDRVP